MSGCAVLMIIYICVIRPQREKINVVLTAAGEFIMLFLHLISIYFLDETLDENKANTIGWVINCLVGAYILINWGIVIALTVMDLK